MDLCSFSRGKPPGYRTVFVLVCMFLLCATFNLAFSQEIHMPLQDVVSLALQQNLQIKATELDPLIAQALVQKDHGVFDPVPYIEFSGDKTKSRAATTLDGAEISVIETKNWDAGWVHKLPTGTSYDLALGNRKYETNSAFARGGFGINPSYRSQVILSVTQPILKGFGVMYNMGEIEIDLSELKSAELILKEKMSQIVLEVQRVYWELTYAIEALKVAQESCKLAEDLLVINRAQFDAGKIPWVDVLEAEAELADRNVDVIKAEQLVADLVDDMRNILNVQDKSVSIIPSDPLPFVTKRLSLAELLKMALQYRYDYLRAKEQLHAKIISLDLAENEVLPDLSLTGSWGINGLGESYSEDIDRLGTFDYYNWSIGLRLEIPLGNRAARGALRKAKLEKEKALIELENMENVISIEVEKAYRQTMVGKRQVEATQVAEQFASEKLRMEEKRYEVGRSTTHKLLQFQEDFAEARSTSIRALADYNIALVELKDKTGSGLRQLPSEP